MQSSTTVCRQHKIQSVHYLKNCRTCKSLLIMKHKFNFNLQFLFKTIFILINTCYFMWDFGEMCTEMHFGSILYRQILTKSESCWHTLVTLPNIKFHENSFSDFYLLHSDRQTEKCGKANTGIFTGPHCKCAIKNKHYGACSFLNLTAIYVIINWAWRLLNPFR